MGTRMECATKPVRKSRSPVHNHTVVPLGKATSTAYTSLFLHYALPQSTTRITRQTSSASASPSSSKARNTSSRSNTASLSRCSLSRTFPAALRWLFRSSHVRNQPRSRMCPNAARTEHPAPRGPGPTQIPKRIPFPHYQTQKSSSLSMGNPRASPSASSTTSIHCACLPTRARRRQSAAPPARACASTRRTTLTTAHSAISPSSPLQRRPRLPQPGSRHCYFAFPPPLDINAILTGNKPSSPGADASDAATASASSRRRMRTSRRPSML